MEDSEIIELYFERSERAVAETEKKYGSLCQKISSNILRDHHDTDECINDTMMKLWNEIPPQKPLLLGAFTAKIARNTAVSMLRKKTASKRCSNETALCIDELDECIPDTMNGYIHERLEIRDQLDKFLESLNAGSRVIFMRRYWFAYSEKQIADELSMSVAAVKMSLSRTRKQFRKYFENEVTEHEKR